MNRATTIAGMREHPVARRGAKLVSYALLAGLAGVLLLLGAATLPVLAGFHTYTVDGGSMEPALKRGSVAIASSTSPQALQIGDVIAYRQSPDNPPVLHRIIQITTENGKPAFITQGDQNETSDSRPVVLQGPGDKVVFSVPYAGHILHYTQGALGHVLLIGLPGAALLFLFLTPMNPFGRSKREKAPAASPSTAGAQRPSLEEQAAARGMLAVVPGARAPLEAQASQLLERQSWPSLAEQALVLQPSAPHLVLLPSAPRRDEARQTRAA
jgi:signal peptidase I